jgi:hypothetical protein
VLATRAPALNPEKNVLPLLLNLIGFALFIIKGEFVQLTDTVDIKATFPGESDCIAILPPAFADEIVLGDTDPILILAALIEPGATILLAVGEPTIKIFESPKVPTVSVKYGIVPTVEDPP